jgi:hypothetical protein
LAFGVVSVAALNCGISFGFGLFHLNCGECSFNDDKQIKNQSN